MARREERYPLKDISEFYALVQKLFTEDEAAIAAQMNSRMITAGTIAVYTCFCRHEAKLLDEHDNCGMPMEVCMLLGVGAKFFTERGVTRQLTKKEAPIPPVNRKDLEQAFGSNY